MNKHDKTFLVLYLVGAFLSATFLMPLLSEKNDIAVIAGSAGLVLTVFLLYQAIVLIYQVLTEEPINPKEGDCE